MGFRQKTRSNKKTTRQHTLIWKLYREQGLDHDDDTRYAMQESITGQRSMTLWSTRDASNMIKHLKGLNGEPAGGPPIEAYTEPPLPKAATPPKLSNDPPSVDQMSTITQLFENMGAFGTVKTAFFRRQLNGKPWPQTVAEAQAVIEALKRMYARNYKFTKAKKKPAK